MLKYHFLLLMPTKTYYYPKYFLNKNIFIQTHNFMIVFFKMNQKYLLTFIFILSTDCVSVEEELNLHYFFETIIEITLFFNKAFLIKEIYNLNITYYLGNLEILYKVEKILIHYLTYLFKFNFSSLATIFHLSFWKNNFYIFWINSWFLLTEIISFIKKIPIFI